MLSLKNRGGSLIARRPLLATFLPAFTSYVCVPFKIEATDTDLGACAATVHVKNGTFFPLSAVLQGDCSIASAGTKTRGRRDYKKN